MRSTAGVVQAVWKPLSPSICTRHVRQLASGERSGSLQSCGSAIPSRLTASRTDSPFGTSTGRWSMVSETVTTGPPRPSAATESVAQRW